jgi:hypothetical protein
MDMREILNEIGRRMKRLILTAAAAVLFSALTLYAQTATSTPVVAIPKSAVSHKQHHNKQHSKQKTHHPHHHNRHSSSASI